jgi:hypothetical protein
MRSFNVLVGPNNAGKSTVLDGLRLLWGAHRLARQRNPALLSNTDDGMPSGWGWQIPLTSFPFDLENIHTNYQTDPAINAINLSRNSLK